MSSIRKRYNDASPHQDDPPVTTPPTDAAKLPEPAVDVKPPPEMPETKESPADVAAKNALRERLREMENAETLTRQAQQPSQYAAEPRQQPQEPPTLEQQIAHLPERVQRWYKAEPRFLTDPEQAARIQYAHHVATREVGEQFTDPYFARMEQMLGLAPRSNGQTQSRPIERPSAPAPRYEAPPRQQYRQSAPVSAPPSREPASMSTGRPQSFRAPLTADELEIARASGITPERYAQEKEKMLRMKALGQIQDGR
jgi:hypothetical protein